MTTTDEPLAHIPRPMLPWRAEDFALTECGKPLADVASVITLDDWKSRVKRDGKRRTSYSVCETCAHQAQRSRTFAQHPMEVLDRAVMRARRGNGELVRFQHELHAIAALIAAHPDEFTDYLDGLDHTVSLDERRRLRKRRG